jgi:hypothetical protein
MGIHVCLNRFQDSCSCVSYFLFDAWERRRKKWEKEVRKWKKGRLGEDRFGEEMEEGEEMEKD